MSTLAAPITIEQVMADPPAGRWELVYGELVTMAPAGDEHGSVAGNFYYLLRQWVEKRGLGRVYAAETGYILQRDPDVLRAPDTSFLTRARMRPKPLPTFYEGAPDFAVEVVSPGDRESEVADKVRQWLDAGTREVWVAWPRTRSVTVHRPGADVLIVHEGDTVEAGPVLPGFTVAVSEVFA